MTDYFAVLDHPRRPWLDVDKLKDDFHTLSAAAHPDRVHNQDEPARRDAEQRYSELNAAYQCLRSPKTRLEHLLLLERGSKPGDLRSIPDDVVQLFSEVATLLKNTEGVLTQKARATSAIQKAGLLTQAMPYLEKIALLQSSIRSRLQEVGQGLHALDKEWPGYLQDPGQRPSAFATAEKLYHLYGFLDRWTQQLQERMIQLTL